MRYQLRGRAFAAFAYGRRRLSRRSAKREGGPLAFAGGYGSASHPRQLQTPLPLCGHDSAVAKAMAG